MPCRPSGRQNEKEGVIRRPEVECATAGIYTRLGIPTEQSESQWMVSQYGYRRHLLKLVFQESW
jgi:hypothetical protein